MTPRRIIWHHSAFDSNEPQFDKIDAWHKDRGFPLSSLGYYVGYHYVIEPNGVVKQARQDTEIGAHDAGENSDSIGICLAGDFNKNMPTKEQEVAFKELWLRLIVGHKIPVLAIEPHRRDDTTDCPGKNLTDDWPLNNI